MHDKTILHNILCVLRSHVHKGEHQMVVCESDEKDTYKLTKTCRNDTQPVLFKGENVHQYPVVFTQNRLYIYTILDLDKK